VIDQPTTLELALVAHVLEMLVVIEGLPEERIELDTAVAMEEDIGATLQGLTEQDRQKVRRIALSLADEADATGRSGAGLRQALDWIGLLETS
jgi:hypothetical protein